jgi:hypothetical protein
MDEATLEDLAARLRAVEDVLAVQRIVLSYGPAADAGLSRQAASLWLEDGVYDWDTSVEPLAGRAAVDGMLQGENHQGLIAEGVAHFAGAPVVEVDGDRATALTYSLVMRREEGRFYLWRVSANRWELERDGRAWRVRHRTNRVLDASGAGRELFAGSVPGFFPGV